MYILYFLGCHISKKSEAGASKGKHVPFFLALQSTIEALSIASATLCIGLMSSS